MDVSADSSDGQFLRSAVRRFEQRLMLYATHLLGDAERARDLVQDTFLKLCAQDRQRVEPHLAEWLFTVCRNGAMDIRRKEKRMRGLDEDFALAQKSHEPDPSRSIESQDDQAKAQKLIDQLPPNQQECIRLKFQHGLSYDQISRVTGLTTTNVGYLIHMGLKTVRMKMN